MGFSLYQLNLKNLFWNCISFSITSVLVLVSLGPTFDHHFVERQHNHSHIYLNAIPTNHWHPESHPFEEPHSHSKIGTDLHEHGNVIYQTSNNGISDSVTGFTAALTDDSYPWTYKGASTTERQSSIQNNLAETIVRPLKRPPRT